MESQQLALSCTDDFIASIVVAASENPRFDDTLIMSDDNFAHELQLQEVIISSLISLPPPRCTNGGESSKTAAKGGGGGPSQSLCEICTEKKDGDAFFPLRSCSHAFCKDCISRYVSIKVKKRTIAAAAAIACPGAGCGGALEIAACREVVPREIAGMWDEQLCEAAVAAEERVYCPYRNCSALLVNDGGGGGGGGEIREAECPFCRRLFCARCGVPWHAGIDCEGFSKLGKDEREREDLMVHDLAKKNKWKRCSNCNFFVEKNDGCMHMTCRF